MYAICITDGAHIKGIVNSPHHGQRLHRTGSVDTLSPCESIASDDLMLDYDGSDASSYEEQQRLALSNIIFDKRYIYIYLQIRPNVENVHFFIVGSNYHLFVFLSFLD